MSNSINSSIELPDRSENSSGNDPSYHLSDSNLIGRASQQIRRSFGSKNRFTSILEFILGFLLRCAVSLGTKWSAFKKKVTAKRDQWHTRAITIKNWLNFVFRYLWYFITTLSKAIWARVAPPVAKEEMQARIRAVKDTATILSTTSATGLAVSFLSTIETSGKLLALAENTRISWSLSLGFALLAAFGAVHLLQLIDDITITDIKIILRVSCVLFSIFLWASAALLWTGLSIFMWGEVGTTWKSKGATIVLWVALSFGFAAIIIARWAYLERSPPLAPDSSAINDVEQGGEVEGQED